MQFLTVINSDNTAACDASLMLTAYFQSQNIKNVCIKSQDAPRCCDLKMNPDKHCLATYIDDIAVQSASSIVDIVKHFDMAIALGGDGTLLRTAALVAPSNIPILGINFGHLGFLTNSNEQGVVEIVAAAMSGDVTKEDRTNIYVDVYCEDDSSSQTFFALNEVSVARGMSGRGINLQLSISGSDVADVYADGVVVSTATGSTAYALSAGGPLVAPGFGGLIVVPLAAHTLLSRAIVTDQNDIVEVDVSNNDRRAMPALFVDGEQIDFDAPLKRIVVRRGDTATRLLKYKAGSFYDSIARSFFQSK